MRLANGIIIDKEKTFGLLKFSALRREVHKQNEDGTVSEEIKERIYDLKSREQGRMIQVSIPAAFQGADVDWYIKAEDIILKNRDGHSTGNLQNHNPHDKKEIKNHK